MKRIDLRVPTAAWRACALVAIAVTVVVFAGDLLAGGSFADYGFQGTPAPGTALAIRVAAVAPGSAAERAGIFAGALVAPAPTLADRVAFVDAVSARTPLAVDVTQGGTTHRVLLTTQSERPGALPYFIAFEALRVVMLAVALLIVMRRPERPDARALATFLIAFAFGFLGRPAWYPPWLTFAFALARPIAVLFALEQALVFATIFPQASPSGVRRLLRAAAPAMFAIAALALGGELSANHLLGRRVPYADLLASAAAVAMLAGIAIAFVIAGRESSAADRPRLRWIGVSIAAGLCGLVVTVVLEQLPSTSNEPWIYLFACTLVAIPIGTAYAILRHRMLDVGFVVSRALVFTVLSSIVVLAFIVLEWLLGKYLVSASHVQSVALEGALALALGLSMQRLHARVDTVVDTVFFRERHLAERALQRLTIESAYFSDPEALVARMLEALDGHGRSGGSALYLFDGSAYARRAGTNAEAAHSVDYDDPVAVSLRATRAPVAVGEPGMPSSALHSGLAFPMLVRGDLVGLVACAPRTDGEEYAPDERATIASLANAVGTALEILQNAALRRAVDRTLSGESTVEALRDARLPLLLVPAK